MAVTRWQSFVLEHGRQVPGHYLAAIVGQPETAINRFRSTRRMAQRSAVKGFHALFALYHGRPPQDAEWPRPHCAANGAYEWLGPELALLASLVGRVSTDEICRVLTGRLRSVTGDPTAARNRTAVLIRQQKIGLQSSDVPGITVQEAVRQSGISDPAVRRAIRDGELVTTRVGRLLVIDQASFDAWRTTQRIPDGHVPLSDLRGPLAFSSDSKLPEYAQLGYIPGAVRIGRGRGGRWYLPASISQQILADARAGRPLPWHGKTLPCNLKAAWRRWQARRHRQCAECRRIWGASGPPRDQAAFSRRYAELTQGDKRHLTRRAQPGTIRPSRKWGTCRGFRASGLTPWEAARALTMPPRWVQGWIRRGLLDRGGIRRDPRGGEAIRVTPLGIATLKVARAWERRRQERVEWMGVFAAAQHAAVSISTVHQWRRTGQLATKKGPRGLRFNRRTLEATARAYWRRSRLRRAQRPAWLREAA